MALTNRSNDGGVFLGRKFSRGTFGDFKSNGQKARVKQAPPEQTNAENFYYLKQMSARTPMVVVMSDGEEIRGWIEWYDRTCLKLNREDAPNLLIQKHYIKYLFKEDELLQD